MHSQQDFGMPDKYLRQFRYGIYAGIMLTAVMMFFVSASSEIKLAVFFSSTLLSFVGYQMLKRQIFVSLTDSAILGKGNTGRRVEILWSETVTIKETKTGQHPGINILPNRDDEKLVKSLFGKTAISIFIPKQILKSEPFKQTVFSLAPQWHPLREYCSQMDSK